MVSWYTSPTNRCSRETTQCLVNRISKSIQLSTFLITNQSITSPWVYKNGVGQDNITRETSRNYDHNDWEILPSPNTLSQIASSISYTFVNKSYQFLTMHLSILVLYALVEHCLQTSLWTTVTRRGLNLREEILFVFRRHQTLAMKPTTSKRNTANHTPLHHHFHRHDSQTNMFGAHRHRQRHSNELISKRTPQCEISNTP